MSSTRQMSRILKTACPICFDDSSKMILMSDCHRGCGDQRDDFAPNRTIFLSALNYYEQHNYTYIERGDGDELWENRYFSDIVSAHPAVFQTLQRFYREQRFYMIYGNHDMVKKKQQMATPTC